MALLRPKRVLSWSMYIETLIFFFLLCKNKKGVLGSPEARKGPNICSSIYLPVAQSGTSEMCALPGPRAFCFAF